MTEEFHRMKRLPPYVIAKVNEMRLRQAARNIKRFLQAHGAASEAKEVAGG